MPQTDRLQIITRTSAPQSVDHLGRYGNMIAEVPFPSPNYNHSSTPYTRPKDFSGVTGLSLLPPGHLFLHYKR